MRPSASELASPTTSPTAPRRPARLSTILAFGGAFLVVALVLFEGSRRAEQYILPVVGPYVGLAIMAVTGFISGAMFFSSPAMWLRIWAHATPGTAEPLWLMTAEVVGPFFVYGAVHGMLVPTGLSWRSMARAIAWRYLVTFLAVVVVGVSVGMIVLAFDS